MTEKQRNERLKDRRALREALIYRWNATNVAIERVNEEIRKLVAGEKSEAEETPNVQG